MNKQKKTFGRTLRWHLARWYYNLHTPNGSLPLVMYAVIIELRPPDVICPLAFDGIIICGMLIGFHL